MAHTVTDDSITWRFQCVSTLPDRCCWSLSDRCGATSRDRSNRWSVRVRTQGQWSACAYFRQVRLYLMLFFRVYLSVVHDVLLRMLGLQGFACCFQQHRHNLPSHTITLKQLTKMNTFAGIWAAILTDWCHFHVIFVSLCLPYACVLWVEGMMLLQLFLQKKWHAVVRHRATFKFAEWQRPWKKLCNQNESSSVVRLHDTDTDFSCRA